MTRRKLFGLALFCTALGIPFSMPTNIRAQEPPLKIGMAKTFFNDLPPAVVGVVTEPFGKLLKQTTGLDGDLLTDLDAFGTAANLDAGKLQFGVFHGHEFPWVQKKYPLLKPLMVVANKQHNVQAFVIVKKESAAQTIANLRGKTVDFPAQTKEHCRVFVGQKCGDNAQKDPKAFFSKIERSETYFDALNDLCKGKVDAVVVDSISLAFYKDIKGPVFDKNLRVLVASEPFPAAVIAYKDGAVTTKVIGQFREGLLKAHDNPVGADMMKMWSIDGFELPPANYAEMLTRCLKEYPAP
jgi:ABC-type phosphate/phosphonate transport system substrate-binding protein